MLFLLGGLPALQAEGSMRRKESKRKDERTRREEKKAAERAAAEAETRRLMNLKREEVRGLYIGAVVSPPLAGPAAW
jgi:hypothetical protein